MVDVKIGLPLIISSSLFAPLGAYATSKVNTIRRIFGVVLLVFVLKLLHKVLL